MIDGDHSLRRTEREAAEAVVAWARRGDGDEARE
jgi:hypothetical protein